MFRPENLYEEIDGEAELFLPYDFRSLSVGIVMPTDNATSEIRLELYRLGSPLDAFGIFSRYRFPDQEIVLLPPSEAIVSDSSLDSYRGDYFFRIQSASADVSRTVVLALAKAILATISGPAGTPTEATPLDIPEKVPGTLVYQKTALMGIGSLAPGFEARFEAPGISGEIFLLLPVGDKKGRRPIFEVTRELKDVEEVAPGTFRASIPASTLWFSAAGKAYVGVAGSLSKEQAVDVLKTLKDRARHVFQ